MKDSCKTAGLSVTHGEAHKLSHTTRQFISNYKGSESIICLYNIHFQTDPELYNVKNYFSKL